MTQAVMDRTRLQPVAVIGDRRDAFAIRADIETRESAEAEIGRAQRDAAAIKKGSHGEARHLAAFERYGRCAHLDAVVRLCDQRRGEERECREEAWAKTAWERERSHCRSTLARRERWPGCDYERVRSSAMVSAAPPSFLAFAIVFACCHGRGVPGRAGHADAADPARAGLAQIPEPTRRAIGHGSLG